MKLISWNVNGLRACLKKGFMESFAKLNADVFCLQETKMQPDQAILDLPGYKQYWNSAERKGYSGTAVFSKIDPIAVTNGIGIEEHDHEGRVITLEFPKIYVVTVYTPNSKRELERLDYRMKWEDAFREYILTLDAKKPVVICGDLNVAHTEIDLKILRRIIIMLVLPMRSGRSLLSSWLAVLSIPSACFIQSKKIFIPGGHICAKHVIIMLAGG